MKAILKLLVTQSKVKPDVPVRRLYIV